jgi:hypothetical protein
MSEWKADMVTVTWPFELAPIKDTAVSSEAEETGSIVESIILLRRLPVRLSRFFLLFVPINTFISFFLASLSLSGRQRLN